MLQDVVVNVTGNPAELSIRANAANFPIASVDRILKFGSGETWLTELPTSGDVGRATTDDAIDVSRLVFASIGGSVIGNTSVNSPNTIGSISNMTVAGNMLGNITATNSSISGLTVSGSIGSVSNPVTIAVSKNIDSLIAGSIYADVTANTSPPASIGTFRTTSGDFVGSLTARILNDNGAGVDQRFWIAGNLNADVDILDLVKGDNPSEPEIKIGGNFSQGRTFRIANSLNSGAVLNIETGTGLDGQVIINGNNGAGT
ncbi:MAG: hypothetical protein IT435_14760 [Phycisphaerales bacterium]|nr:hypothetical protein [Phycisphaerales bacterium]